MTLRRRGSLDALSYRNYGENSTISTPRRLCLAASSVSGIPAVGLTGRNCVDDIVDDIDDPRDQSFTRSPGRSNVDPVILCFAGTTREICGHGDFLLRLFAGISSGADL